MPVEELAVDMQITVVIEQINSLLVVFGTGRPPLRDVRDLATGLPTADLGQQHLVDQVTVESAPVYASRPRYCPLWPPCPYVSVNPTSW